MTLVLVERRDGVGLLTLNRPDKLNALSAELVDDLARAIQVFDADDGIGAIVLTGAGERAFSSGGDMTEQLAAMNTTARPFPRLSISAVLAACETPTIAAIRGYCFGGGALLAVECDMRIGSTDARIKFHGASYGRAPGGAMLPRIVGDAKAKELLFSGDEIDGAEALRIGLFNRLVAPDDVVETAVALGNRIAANSPTAVRALKQIINMALPVDTALEQERYVNRDMGRSPDSAARFRVAAERIVGSSPEA